MNIKASLVTVATATALAVAGVPAATAQTSAGSSDTTNVVTQECPVAESFTLTAPTHTEVGGGWFDKQITFGSYWTGGNLPAGTWTKLEAGDATVTLSNGETYDAPVVAGGTVWGAFPNGGAALSPSFRLADSSNGSAYGATNAYNVTSISYPVTVSGDFGSCTFTYEGTATSKFNVTSATLN